MVTKNDNQPHERLKLERTRQNLSAKDFAVSLQIPQTTYGSLERDSGRLEAAGAGTVIKICTSLNIRPEWLLVGEEPKRPSDMVAALNAEALERAILMIQELEKINGQSCNPADFARKIVAGYTHLTK
jgi:transcriptional regulator with XRE-family HTH domain